MDVTDKPLTRNRRKMLESAGLTPVLLTPSAAGFMAGPTPKKCEVAKDLFKHDEVSQDAAACGEQEAEDSPVDKWIKGDSGEVAGPQFGSPVAAPAMSVSADPRTPDAIGPPRVHEIDGCMSPLTRMLGPTPNNTLLLAFPCNAVLSFSPHPTSHDVSTPPSLGSADSSSPALTPVFTGAPATGGPEEAATPDILGLTPWPATQGAPPSSAGAVAPTDTEDLDDLMADLDDLTTPGVAAPDSYDEVTAEEAAFLGLDSLTPTVKALVDGGVFITPVSARTQCNEPLPELSPVEGAVSATPEPLALSPVSAGMTMHTLSSLSTPTMLQPDSDSSFGGATQHSGSPMLVSPGDFSHMSPAGFTIRNTPASMLLDTPSERGTNDTLANPSPADNFLGRSGFESLTPHDAMPYIARAESVTPSTENLDATASPKSWFSSAPPSRTPNSMFAVRATSDDDSVLPTPMLSEAPSPQFSFPMAEFEAEPAENAESENAPLEAAAAGADGSESPVPAERREMDCEAGGDTPPALLEHNGMDDDIPTPVAFVPHPVDGPCTPDDQQVKAFGVSSGSCFATPEVPIHTGMTALTTAEMRAAARHIPAWNRISKLVCKESPLAHELVLGMWNEPALQHWAITPWKLLERLCKQHGWSLTMRNATETKIASIGATASVIATVQIPEGFEGVTVVGHGKCAGQLESLIVAAASALDNLLAAGRVTAKDAHSAAAVLSASLAPAAGPLSNLGRTPRPAVAPFGRHLEPAVRTTSILAPRAVPALTPVPVSPLQAPKAATPAQQTPAAAPPAAIAQLTPAEDEHDYALDGAAYTPVDFNDMITNAYLADGRDIMNAAPSPEHPGIGVRAPPDVANCPTPEMVLLEPKFKAKPVRQSTAGATPPAVYHAPFRTGKTAVANKAKATVAATAKPTGLAAIKQHQVELERLAKQNKSNIMALTERLGNVKLAATYGDTAKSPAPLKGVPMPVGRHTVFDDAGVPDVKPRRTVLRGVPKATGSHIVFDNDDCENDAGY